MQAFAIVKWGLGTFSALVGVICFLCFYVAYSNVSETKIWPQVPAIVDKTTVTRVDGNKGITYCPKSVVRFQLNGTPYTAELQSSGLVCSRSQDATHQLSAQWPSGKEVQVHVNPSKPTQVRTSNFSLHGADYLVLLVGCLCFLLLLPLRHLKSKETQSHEQLNR